MSDISIPGGAATPSSAAAVATATLGDLINQVRGYLYSGQRVERNRLTSSITSSSTSLAFDFTTNAIEEGAKLSIEFEDIHVWTGTGSAANPVQRGEFGSTAASHGAGSIVHINSPASNWDILREINNELRFLSSPVGGLFAVSYKDITYSAATIGYDLGVPDLIDVIEVRAKAPGPSADWPLLTQWTLTGDQNLSDFASGNALFLYELGYQGQPVRVFYKKVYSVFSSTPNTGDNVQTTTGLHGEAHPVLAMGAALRLAGVWEISRNLSDRQGDTRRATEVPPGAKNAAPAGLLRQYASARSAEAGRLRRRYPVRLRRLR